MHSGIFPITSKDLQRFTLCSNICKCESYIKLAETLFFPNLNETAHIAIKSLYFVYIPSIHLFLSFLNSKSNIFETSNHYKHTLIHSANVVFWLSHTLLCRFQFSFAERLFALVRSRFSLRRFNILIVFFNLCSMSIINQSTQ